MKVSTKNDKNIISYTYCDEKPVLYSHVELPSSDGEQVESQDAKANHKSPVSKMIVLVLVCSVISICAISRLSAQEVSAQRVVLAYGNVVINPLDTQSAASASFQEDTYDEVPVLLKGIWYNSNRYVIFDTGYSNTNASVPQIVLRTFYTWYDDRAAESPQYTQKTQQKTINVAGEERYVDETKTPTVPAIARDKNNAVSRQAEEIKIRFIPLVTQAFPSSYNMPVTLSDGRTLTADEIPSGAWDLEITYPRNKTVYHVPVAVIGNNLYLNFTVKALPATGTAADENQLIGFWKDNGNASGILVSPPITSKELLSYYVTSNAVYHIRYWKTDMDYDADAEAVFSDGDQSFSVKKHLFVGGVNYTCVEGRGTKIRNIEKGKTFPKTYTCNSVLITSTIIDEQGNTATVTQKAATICALGEPYLSLTDGKSTIEQLVLAANSRHKPLPPPPFPAHGGAIDFHWEIVKDLPVQTYVRVLSIGKQ